MRRPTATIDANVAISAFVFRGLPRKIISAAASQLFQSVTAESILAEIDQKLRFRFGKSDVQVAHMLRVMRRFSRVVQPQEMVSVCRDAKDNHILECAVAGRVDVIVEGDKDLLRSAPSASSLRGSSWTNLPYLHHTAKYHRS